MELNWMKNKWQIVLNCCYNSSHQFVSSTLDAMKIAWNMTCPWSNLTCKLCPWLLTLKKKTWISCKSDERRKRMHTHPMMSYVFKTLIRSGHVISRTCAWGTRSKKPFRKLNSGTFHTTLNLNSWSPVFKNQIFCLVVGLWHKCTSTQIELSRIINNCTRFKTDTTLYSILKGPRLPC